MTNLFYKNGIKFECKGSSNCCVSRGSYGYVYLSNIDIIRFANFMKLSINKFKKKYCDKTDGYTHLKETKKNRNCQFLNHKKCSVYIARPTQCRTWPFWKENMNSKKWNKELKKFCPGIGKGKLVTLESIQKNIREDLINDEKI